VLLVSDTHLAPDGNGGAQANWDAVLRHIGAAPPDLVLHLGDLTNEGAREPGDLQFGSEQLDRLTVPWRAVPGNHDIGDNPWPGLPAELVVDESRRQRWLDVIGTDHWSLTAEGWTLLAINAQLPGSGLAAEAAQWSWLEQQVRAERGNDQLIALVTHKPVAGTDAEMATAPPYRFWPASARDRLADVFGDTPPALVISGHVHQYRQLRLGGTDHLWAPTTWAVLADEVQPVFGAKRCGIVSVEFAGRTPPQPALIEPAGIAQLAQG
jgi:3',5'-cyclic AMP phosphodiesterase CpdA